MISIQKFMVNPLRENSYLLYDETGECIILDAGFFYEEEFTELEDFIGEKQLTPKMLINTHCHFDHLFGISTLKEKYQIDFLCHREDEFLIERSVEQAAMFGFPMNPASKPDGYLQEGSEIIFGNSCLKAIHVPGHSPGHLVFHSAEGEFIVAGDVLFYGSIGRTDLPGGSYNDLIENIKGKLLVLPPGTTVYSGHGPETTIGFEKDNNPFLT